MNQTEMLHQMCHEVLAEADVRAICKNRGLPNQVASSRQLLENLFLSDTGGGGRGAYARSYRNRSAAPARGP